MNTLATKMDTTIDRLGKKAQDGSKLAAWPLLALTILGMIITPVLSFMDLLAAHPRVMQLRARSQAGDAFTGWILVILAVIAISVVVIGAVNGWFAARTAELGA